MSGGINSYIRVYPGDASDNGKTITLQGYDANGQWIRTQSGGVWIDGEKLTLALPYVQSSKKFTALTGVIREATNTASRLYEYNQTLFAEIDLAVYDPDETLPQYRRSLWTGRNSDCCTQTVTVIGKMRHINATSVNDYLIPPCPDAIKLMVMAISEENKMNLQGSTSLAGQAVAVLAKKEESRTMTQGTPVILDSDYRTSLGRVMNRRVIL
jgi:hypothetical protein